MSFGDEHHEPAPAADALDAWPTFSELVRRRLENGRRVYGDRSFGAEPAALLAELQQECLDLAGWGFVLFCRLEAMQRALERQRDPEPARSLGRLVGSERGRP